GHVRGSGDGADGARRAAGVGGAVRPAEGGRPQRGRNREVVMPFASTIRPARRRRPRPAGRAAAARRGVASVLAMMFLILFGSLVAAMAVASTGNIRTAASHLSVMRAQAAAETG